MHDAAHQYVQRFRTDDPSVRVVDIGARDINGTVRDLFPNTLYVGIDVEDGKGVDVVASGAVYKPTKRAHIVVCCEVFEHCAEWRDIVANVHDNMLVKGGTFVATMAGPTRLAHSAIDGGPLRDGEFYENIDPTELEAVMADAGFVDVEIDEVDADVRVCGVKA